MTSARDEAAASLPATALTAEQRQAIDPAAHAWVSASAGTGKTHVLVGRVLRLLLAGAHPQSILCLTYTRAAAAEMRNRLLARLSAFAAADDEALAGELAGLLGRKPTEDETGRARRLFLDVLELPEGLKIETVHAFSQSLLARFPLEAGLAPHFRVAEEAEARLLFEDAFNAVLKEAGLDPALADALAELAGQYADAVLAERLQLAITNRHRIAAALADRSTDGHMAALRRALNLEDEDEETVITRFFAQEALDRALLRQMAEACAGGGKQLQNLAAAIRAYLALEANDPAERLAAYRPIFLTKYGGGRNRNYDKQIARYLGGFHEAWAAAADRLVALEERLKAVRVFRPTRAFLLIARRLIAAYEERKAAAGLLDFTDLVHHARRLLESPGVAPWVLYKLDRAIRHVLVDEAQDSNSQQWALVGALMAEAFAGEGAADGAHSLFAVGDVKQSIYRFQGAEPEAFQSAYEQFKAKAQNARQRLRPVSLSRSFRSAPAILSYVDAVFAGEEGRRLLGLDEEEVHHRAHREKAPGLVELWAPEGPRKGEDEDEGGRGGAGEEGEAWRLPDGITLADDPAGRLARRIADRIAEMLEQGELLHSENRAIRAGDILVLVRRRNDFVDKLLAALRARGVPVAGQDRLVVTDSLAVQDLMAAARFALLPEDDLNLAALLKSPLIGLDDDDLLAFAPAREGSLWDTFRRWAAAHGKDALLARLSGWLKQADLAPPYAFFTRVLMAEGGLARLMARLGPDIVDPVTEFLAYARRFGEDGLPSLQHFLSALKHTHQEIKRDLEEGRDEVRVMTIHGAKGLEAPIVFLPDTASRPQEHRDRRLLVLQEDAAGPGAPPLLAFVPAGGGDLPQALREVDETRIRREQEEYWRLLYVALTRARDRLYIAGWYNKKGPDSKSWYPRLKAAMCALLGHEESDAPQPVLRYPASHPLARTARKAAPGPKQPRFALPAWAREKPRPEPPGRGVLSPSRAQAEETAADAAPVLSPLTRGARPGIACGRLLHALLQHLPALPPQTRRAAAHRFLAQQAADLPAPEREDMIEEALAVLEEPAFAPLFSPAARAEVPLVGMIAGRPVAGRVDRLLVTDERVLVVDYKGLRPAPRTPEATPRAYLRQMALYRALIRAAWPGRPVEAALLFTAVPRLMPLADPLLDAALPAWAGERPS